MSRLSQLNKADAHKALAALAQKQQTAAMQFDGDSAFSAILSAQSGHMDAIEDNTDRQQQDRAPQDDQQPKQAQLVQPRPAQPQAKDTRPLPEKKAAQPATQTAAKSDDTHASAAVHETRKAAVTEKHADKDAKQDSDAAPVDAQPAIAADTPAQPVTVDAQPVEAKPAKDAAQPDILVVQPAALPQAVAVPAPATAEPQALPLHMLLALGGNPAAADKATPVAAPVVAAPQGQELKPALQPVAAAMPALVADAPAAPALPAAAQAAQAQAPLDLLANAAQPATPADVTKAAASVLQQLAPMAHALTQQAAPQAVPQAVKAPVLQAQPAPIAAAQPVAAQTATDLQADAATTQPVTANPLLAANDAAPAAGNPLLNPQLNAPNPVLQTPGAQAAAAAPATGFTATANAQVAESQINVDGVGFDVSLGNHTLARYDAGSMARMGKLPNTAAGAALPANVQVAVQLARAAKSGDKSFNIQLHPAELGRVEVKLEVDSHGAATARIMVDSQATLDLLQNHSAGLEQALTDAGLKCDTGGISFDLRDSGQSNQQQANGHEGGRNGGKNNALPSLSGTADASVDPSIIANMTLSLQPGRVDIKA